MTDQIPDVTDKDRRLARDWAEHIINTPESSLPMETAAARALLAVLPPRPTLADMTPQERAACQWLQADVANVEARAVIVNPNEEDGKARVAWPGGFNKPIDWKEVTPHPDVPCMEWPGTEKPAPALPDGWRLADHKEHGRVIVTSASTSSDGDGYVYTLFPDDDSRGYDWFFCPTKRLTFLDGEGDHPE